MKTCNNIENPTRESIKKQMINLINTFETSEEVMNGTQCYAEIYICFQNKTALRLCPTWWDVMGGMSFHYSDTAEDSFWLDSDDDKGDIEGNDPIEAALDLVEDYSRQHGGIWYSQATFETEE